MKTMKTQRVLLPLAFLSAAFMLGCQDQGLEPVGLDGVAPQFRHGGPPPHPPKEPGPGGPAAATLDLAGGIVTAGLEVEVKDSRKKLSATNIDFVQEIQMSFVNRGTCVGLTATKSGVLPDAAEIADLEAELETPVTDGFFTMQIDKTSLGTTGRHRINVQRDGTFFDPTGATSIQLGSPFDQVEGSTVTQVGTDPDVFEFTGPVVVWASGVDGNGTQHSLIIQCPGTGEFPNQVVATVNLTP